MGNVAVAEILAGSDELDKLYKLNASESEPEPEPEPEDEPEDDEGKGVQPEGMPHD
jgi:hypothetical protein